MHYRMIAIDLDGTLLDRRGRVSDRNIAAVERAQLAGILVVPCTGRGWIESRVAFDAFARHPREQPGVFVTGAAVTELHSGKTQDLAVIEPHLALQIVHALYALPEAVLLYRDFTLCGHDYLVTGQGSLSPQTQWWFELTGATVHFQRDVSLDDMHHVLRLAVVADESRMRQIREQLQQRFAGRVFIQSFAAVQREDERESVHVLEIFAQGVDKWRGLCWIARKHDFDPSQIAVIGDEINDVTMVSSAGCGIAMRNAINPVKAVANHITLDCDDSGVAHAIDRLLAGEWGREPRLSPATPPVML